MSLAESSGNQPCGRSILSLIRGRSGDITVVMPPLVRLLKCLFVDPIDTEILGTLNLLKLKELADFLYERYPHLQQEKAKPQATKRKTPASSSKRSTGGGNSPAFVLLRHAATGLGVREPGLSASAS